jgi:tight adherence protein C
VPDPSFIEATFSSTQLLTVIGAAVFGGVFLLSMAISRMINARNAIRRRALKDFAFSGYLDASGDDWLDRRSVRHQLVAKASRVILDAATKLGPSDKQSKASGRMEMVRAGYFNPSAMYWYYVARIFCGLALPSAFLFSVPLLPYSLSATKMVLAIVFFGLMGFSLPGFYLHRCQARLKEQLRRGFPDFMDLMVVCVEAGVSPSAAIDRVGRELALNHAHLGANLHLVSLELRAGQDLTQAMQNFADRVGLEEILSLAALLRQSEELGTSLAEALRVYSSEMRDKRLSRAQEKAYALPVKLVLPLGLFIFPVMMVAIMLPLILRFKGVFY